MCVPAGHFFRLVVFRTLFLLLFWLLASLRLLRRTRPLLPLFFFFFFGASLGNERQKTLARGISAFAPSKCSSWALRGINVDAGIYESDHLRRDCFGDECLIFAVLTLREVKPSADSCGDLFLEEPFQSLLPAGCGSEAVFNFSWEKEIDPYGSGDDEDYDDEGDDDDGDGSYIFTTIVPTRTMLASTAATNLRTTGSPSSFVTRNLSLAHNRTATRLPPRFTPSLESRHSSFQHLLRLHMNTFNQRLSMLEKNTLDMKESIQRMEEQQKLLSSQLAQLVSVRAAEEKGEKVGELERSYADMETRLHRLEGRLEILIDGFTALAQEMNKMKRARHASRSVPGRRELPSPTTVRPLPLHPSTPPPVSRTLTSFSSRAPESVPTPGLAATRTSTSSPRLGRKRKPAATNTSTPSTPPLSSTKPSKSPAWTSSAATFKTTQSRTQSAATSAPRATVKPEATTAERRSSAATSKRVSKASSAKPKGAEKEAAVTTFQLEPPPHTSKPDQTRRKNSTNSKGNARNEAFRSDEPDPKKTREAATVSEGNTKESAEPREADSDSDSGQRKTDRGAQAAPRKTNSSTRRAITTAKPAKATAAAQKSSTTAGSTSTSPKAKATVAKKKPNASAKRKSVTPKSKKNSRRKVTKKSQQNTSNVMDLLQLLNGDRRSAKQAKSGESSLHVVLGRLAIPIKIIPDF